MSELLGAMIKDLVKVQSKLPHITKNKKANYGKYADLDSIHDKILPILASNNFAWITMPSKDADTGNPTLAYGLFHTSGESITGEMPLYLAKNDPQGQGSAITYAKRYAICAVVGITADEDDDGQKATKSYNDAPAGAHYDEAPRPLVGKATEKQVEAVKKALFTHGVKTKEDGARALKLFTGEDHEKVDELSKQQASDIIGKIKGMTKEELQGQLMSEMVVEMESGA